MKRMAMLAAASLIVLAGQAQAAVTFTPLVVAGGGGGTNGVRGSGDNGQTGPNGSSARGVAPGAGGSAGAGGAGGKGILANAGGGAGINGAGTQGANTGGASSGGGQSTPTFAGGKTNNNLYGIGGFGGGGGGSNLTGGGGGGYSGGGGAGLGNGGGDLNGGGGGGGGSFIDTSLTSLTLSSTLNATGGNGFVTITSLGGLTQTFNYTGAVQSFTFASDGVYSIVAAGAQGGGYFNRFANDPDYIPFFGGFGAQIGGTGRFTAGSTLDVIVGGMGGISGIDRAGGGGGGGSFVFLTYAAPPVAAVPEPATWATMLAGFGLIGGAMRRRQKIATRVTFA